MSEDIRAYAETLSSLMRKDPTNTNKTLLNDANKVMALYIDGRFGAGYESYFKILKELYFETITDLANGAAFLKTHVVGVAYKNGKFSKFSIPYAENASTGTVVCSISLKKMKAFEQHRKLDEEIHLTQDEINASTYFMVYQLSRI